MHKCRTVDIILYWSNNMYLILDCQMLELGQSDGSGEDEMSQMGISGSDGTGGLLTHQFPEQKGPSDRSIQSDHVDYQSASLWSNSSRYEEYY